MPAMPMTIGIDYDDTITLDRPFWKNFITMVLNAGHDPVIVSCRTDNTENFMVLRDWLGNLWPRVTIILTSHESKVKMTEVEGVKIDVWIDNNPAAVIHGDKESEGSHDS